MHTVFKYLNLLPLGGRGGVTRFFMISQGINYEEDLIAYDESWAKEKARLIESGENPSGTLPMLYCNDKPQPQHIAAARYLARVHKVTSGDDYKDYVQDMVADEYHSFRSQWVSVAFGGDDEVKADYKTGDLVNHLTKFDALYKNFKTEEIFLSVSATTGQPLWGDAAIFGLLRDHILTNLLSLEDLAKYPCLLAMYTAYESIPAVKEWLDSVNKKVDA